MGGGRSNSLSILETVSMLADRGFELKYKYNDQNRTGDHICYISDLTKIRSHFPNWDLSYNLPRIIDEIVERYTSQSKPTVGAAISRQVS
jgi:CDP-paratose 2-epimerase